MVNDPLISPCGDSEATRARSGACRTSLTAPVCPACNPLFTIFLHHKRSRRDNPLEVFAMVLALASAAVGSLICILAVSTAPAWRRPDNARLRGRSLTFESQG